jgi:NAD(P)-dependent dehydrogenase (short-subunit alcohol dehydrogenase family)
MFEFNDKVALVTGGTTGIGFSTATMLARGGAAVAVVGRSENKGAKALSQLAPLKENCIFIAADVSNTNDCRRVVQETVSSCRGCSVVD